MRAAIRGGFIKGDDRTTVKNHNRSIALERSVIDYWGEGCLDMF